MRINKLINERIITQRTTEPFKFKKKSTPIHRQDNKALDPYYAAPVAKCKKCGRSIWASSNTTLTWSCVHCGNLIYYTFGKLLQQIECVMQSSRKNEFVYSVNGKCIYPKGNEDLKKLKF